VKERRRRRGRRGILDCSFVKILRGTEEVQRYMEEEEEEEEGKEEEGKEEEGKEEKGRES